MAETKFTQGPWVAEQQVNKSGESLGWIIEHGNGRIGWSSFATARPNQGEVSPYTQSGFNAHLIAAAPDLYRELDGLVFWLTRHAEGGGETPELVTALDALAKARGETNADGVE